MQHNLYWHLVPKKRKGNLPVILELTPDGMAYIWPMEPRVLQVTVPLEHDQDPDALLTDGDFLEHHGFFRGISDFMNNTKYSASLYEAVSVGEFISIRGCRACMASSDIKE